MILKDSLPKSMAFWDIETRSFANLRRYGSYNYAYHKTTEITCSVWSFEGVIYIWYPLIDAVDRSDIPEVNRVVENLVKDSSFYQEQEFIFLAGEPAKSIYKFLDDGLFWAAHNGWSFDSNVWQARVCRHENILDTMPLFRRCGLPASLDAAGKYCLQAGKNDGYKTMRLLSQPTKRGRNKGNFIPCTPKNFPVLIAYCVCDVLMAEKIYINEVLPYVETPKWEHKNYFMDREINRRGLKFDKKLGEALVDLETRIRALNGKKVEDIIEEMIKDHYASKKKEMPTLGTGDEGRTFLRSRKRVLAWLEEEKDIFLPDFRKDTIETFLLENEEWIDEEVETVLQCRLGESSITTSKVLRGLGAADADGFLYNTLAFNSAHTARWGGRIIQPHNLPRGSKHLDWERCLELLKSLSLLEPTEAKQLQVFNEISQMLSEIVVKPNEYLLKNEPPKFKDVLSILIRPCLIPRSESHIFVIVDLASVEARGVCYLGGDEDGLEVYRQGLDPYKVLASRLFNKDYEDVGGFERFIGKTGELGCGYGMGEIGCEAFLGGYNLDVEKLESIGVTPSLIVNTYRNVHPALAGDVYKVFEDRPIRRGGAWRDFGRAVMAIVRAPTGRRIRCCKCLIYKIDNNLFIELPSGRRLCYRNARIGKQIPMWGGEPVDSIFFDAYKQGRMIKQSTYSGKLIENITQAFCRDLLSWIMVQIFEKLGLLPDLHVHDESIYSVPISTVDSIMHEIMVLMSTPPEWASDFPLKCSGFKSPRYCKEPPKDAEEIEYYLGERVK